VWPGTVLPHCGHLVSCGRCQRLAAFRERSRIFDVLRFGTPIGKENGLGKQEIRKTQERLMG
jgi:hypothetical protein